MIFNNNKTSCKSGGVCFPSATLRINFTAQQNCFKNLFNGSFLPTFKPYFMGWDILFRCKLGNKVKTLRQITPLWLFFSPDEWHIHCNSNNNRKGKLCQHYKHSNLKHHVPAVKLSRFHLMNCQTRLGL